MFFRSESDDSSRNGRPHLAGKTAFTKKLRWLIGNPPEGSVVMEITPAMAEAMLQYNDRNRPVSQSRITRYARDMKAGRWKHTRVPVIFSTDRLLDGQKRLMAALQSGTTFKTDVVFGAEDDAFYQIDQGEVRTDSHIFAINGVPNYSMAAAATRFLICYYSGDTSGTSALGNLTPTREECYQAYLRFHRLQDSIKFGQGFARDRLPAPAIAAAVHYLCAQKSRKAADEYFDKIQSGIGLSSRRDPAYRVREYLTRSDPAPRRRDVAAILIQGWNTTRTRKPLRIVEGEKIGRVV